MGLARARYRWLIAILIILVIVFGWPAKLRRAPKPDPVTPQEAGERPVPAAPGPDAAGSASSANPASPKSSPAGGEAAGSVPPPPVAPAKPQPLMVFQLPTANGGIFKDDPASFFMFVDRYTAEGAVQVWQGGSYGFVRNPRDTAQGTVYTKFHEGIDIAPVERDARGEPLDSVHAIADGVVAYATTSARTSNYGNYVVVRHTIGKTGDFYSLYAHLSRIDAVPGTPIKRGGAIGWMGHTGDGIDRRRSHTHLELGLILSERFEEYYGKNFKLANGHGLYHGSNLAGMDVAAFLIANHKDPQLMPDAFLRSQEVYYKVTVPNRGHEIELAVSHPWMRQGGAAAASWEISFTASGVPTAVAPAAQAVSFPVVSWVKPFAGYHSWNTRSILGGTGSAATLTADGNRMVQLVAGDF
jgi:murein DD-endopeptidase MepM/ murein hydrolase activator NlpD